MIGVKGIIGGRPQPAPIRAPFVRAGAADDVGRDSCPSCDAGSDGPLSPGCSGAEVGCAASEAVAKASSGREASAGTWTCRCRTVRGASSSAAPLWSRVACSSLAYTTDLKNIYQPRGLHRTIS